MEKVILFLALVCCIATLTKCQSDGYPADDVATTPSNGDIHSLRLIQKTGREMNSIQSHFEVHKPKKHLYNPTTESPQCKEIGVKCFTSSECCSRRCNSYIYKCIT